MGIIDKIQDNIKKQEELQAQRIKVLQAENQAKLDERNAKLDKQLEKFHLDNVNQETKESLRYAAGVEYSNLLSPTKHIETRNNELLRAITTQNYILIKQQDNLEKQNDEIISILKDISDKLDK
nr:MAG TPA: hypothetical protein [Caudoviricetes sp.]